MKKSRKIKLLLALGLAMAILFAGSAMAAGAETESEPVAVESTQQTIDNHSEQITSVATGDNSNDGLWGTVAHLSMAGVGLLTIRCWRT